MQNYWIRWPTRVTTHYLTTYFELLSTHFKLCTTHSKFLVTHFKFTTNSEIFTAHFKIFTTHFKIFATHFEIFTTHAPWYPKCWQRKRNGYAAPPSSFDAMFCSTCGQQLQESFVFCPKCGLELTANVAQGGEKDNQRRIGWPKLHVWVPSGHTLRLKYGLCIPSSTVQSLLKELDPVGTEERRKHQVKRRTYSSNGPNECWHVDGYDKLKPFGFPIHGAVNGFCG